MSSLNKKAKASIQRIFEQIDIFLCIMFSQDKGDDLFLIFDFGKTKMILPFSKKKRKFNFKNEKKFFKTHDFFTQELKILKNDSELKNCQNLRKNKDLYDKVFSLFYIFGKTRKKNIHGSLRILNIVSEIFLPETLDKSKKLILMAQALNTTIDTVVIGKDDFSIFYQMASKTKGVYCRPVKNLFKILYTEEFLDILITLFLPSPIIRQLIILPFTTKTFILLTSLSKARGIGFLCSFCSSIYANLPTSCYICGIDLMI